jgi:lysophospholipase L1-like esterase
MSLRRTSFLGIWGADAGKPVSPPEKAQDGSSSPSQMSEPAKTLILRRSAAANDAATSEPNTTPTDFSVPSPTLPGLLYLALGDSYTVGEKVGGAERFPGQLTQRLRAIGFEMRSPQIHARTGWTTADLCAEVAQTRPQGPFDLVTLLIGVNNQYRGLGVDLYRREFEALVDLSIEFAGGEPGRVIVISIPDWGVMPYARNFGRSLIAQQIDLFNRANREISGAKGTRYVNITLLSRKIGDDAAMVAADGLHPSAKQYQQWVDLILPEALAALGQ